VGGLGGGKGEKEREIGRNSFRGEEIKAIAVKYNKCVHFLKKEIFFFKKVIFCQVFSKLSFTR